MFYEDFEIDELPADWTYIIPQNITFIQDIGQVLFYQPFDGEDAVYAVFPKLDINQGCNLSFKAGDSNGRSNMAVGVVTDADNPATTFTEIVSYEIFYADHMHGLGSRFDETIVGDGYLCFKISSSAGNWFYLDNVIVMENMPGAKVQFKVIDQSGEVLPEAEVNFLEESMPTNSYGYATWRDCDPAEYSYTVSYKGADIETGNITVNGDVYKEVVYNTSGITEFEKDQVSLYPNPAKNEFTVNGLTEGHLKIMDLEGRIIREFQIAGNKSIQIDDLEDGIYLIQIDYEGKTLTQKLFKTK